MISPAVPIPISSLAMGRWRLNIQPLLSSTTLQQDWILVIVFDESDDSDSQNGGGHVALAVVTAKAKSGFQSTNVL
jgi:hypothetical protein